MTNKVLNNNLSVVGISKKDQKLFLMHISDITEEYCDLSKKLDKIKNNNLNKDEILDLISDIDVGIYHCVHHIKLIQEFLNKTKDY